MGLMARLGGRSSKKIPFSLFNNGEEINLGGNDFLMCHVPTHAMADGEDVYPELVQNYVSGDAIVLSEDGLAINIDRPGLYEFAVNYVIQPAADAQVQLIIYTDDLDDLLRTKTGNGAGSVVRVMAVMSPTPIHFNWKIIGAAGNGTVAAVIITRRGDLPA